MDISNNQVVLLFPSRFLFCKNIVTSCADLVHSGGTVYTAEEENWEDQEQKLGHPSIKQRLQIFLFLQYNDPFTFQLSDIMGERKLHLHKHRMFCLCTFFYYIFFSISVILP